jgi:hypothetical protein
VSRSVTLWLALVTPAQGLISVLKAPPFSAVLGFHMGSSNGRDNVVWHCSRVEFNLGKMRLTHMMSCFTQGVDRNCLILPGHFSIFIRVVRLLTTLSQFR